MACCGAASVDVVAYKNNDSDAEDKPKNGWVFNNNALHIEDVDNENEFKSFHKQCLERTAECRTRPELIEFLRKNVIGNNITFNGPFGKKNLTYCDFTASGRSIKFIEDYIVKYVCPYYGNTHTTTSVASRQTSQFRDEARDIIKKCVNASPEDVVIYAGSGTTGAIHKLVAVLQLKTNTEKAKNSVILVGPYEHHSNILPWKETGAKILRIKETKQGTINLNDLEMKLKTCRNAKGVVLVTCSAASNVTGIITNADLVASLAHKYGAYAVFDYAAAAPYLKMDMNPSKDGYKDAIVCSPHKFVGGPGTPGLLISKRHMFSNPVPDQGGGGTVLYVTRDTYAYLKDIEAREEGGTPAIIDSIRCGMVFQLKQAIGPEYIETLEEKLTRRAFEAWSNNDRLVILGSSTARRLPIFSFVVKHATSGKYIHHNFMSVILNDVFGIQSRGGCACAGPYAEDLLGIAESMAQNFAKMLEGDDDDNKTSVKLKSALEIMKPGFCRLNFPFFFDEKTADFIIDAVNMATEEGWKLMPQYIHDPHTGVWKHRHVTCANDDTPFSLNDIDYDQPGFGLSSRVYGAKKCAKFNPKKILRAAKKLFSKSEQTFYKIDEMCDNIQPLINSNKHHLIWFLQPRQAARYLTTIPKIFSSRKSSNVVPFRPRKLTTVRSKSTLFSFS